MLPGHDGEGMHGFVISIVADPDTEQVIWDLSDPELLLPLTTYSLEKLHKFYQIEKYFGNI